MSEDNFYGEGPAFTVGRTFDGSPLKSGVNTDRICVAAGMVELLKCGYPKSMWKQHMAIEMALNQWARGDEEIAEKTAIHYGADDGSIDVTSWYRVLAAAKVAGDKNGSARQR